MEAGICISSINSVKPKTPLLQIPDSLENDTCEQFSFAAPK